MGCNCGKRKARTTQTFALTMPNGGKTVHGSKLEAQAANIRQGGGGTVAPKK